MPGQIKGKIGTTIRFNTVANYGVGLFKVLWDYLKYLETEGKVEEVARNNGAGGTGTNWPEEANSFVANCWSVFKWLTSSNRSWEWYLYIQGVPNTSPNQAPAIPATIQGLTSNQNTVAWAAAISVSGSQSENPWGGTTGSLGSDTKGNPVWVSSSNDYNLYLFPRSNSSGGSLETTRQDLGFSTFTDTVASSGLMHAFVISDDDSLLFSTSKRAVGEQVSSFSFFGIYEPFCSILSQSIATPFVAISHNDDTNNIFLGYNQSTAGEPNPNSFQYGAKNANETNIGRRNGGIVGVTGARAVIVDFPNMRTISTTTETPDSLSPNQVIEAVSSSYGSEYSVLPIPLFVSTIDDQPGFLGFLNSEIFKQAPSTPAFLLNDNETRLTLWASAVASQANQGLLLQNAFVVPWKKNIPPRDIAVNRDGLYQGDLE